MSRQANPTIIGAFVVGAIALAVAAVLILAGDQLLRKDTSKYVMYFHGSVKGLNVGSPVMFRGVNIGAVSNIQLVVSKDNIDIHIPVIVEVDNTRFVHSYSENSNAVKSDTGTEDLIKAGLRGQLQLQSLLTGQLFVQLDFLPGTPVNLVSDEMYTAKYSEIPTIQTPIEKLGKLLQDFPIDEVLENIASTTKGMDELVNSPQLTQSLTALHKALDELKTLVARINAELDPLASNANGVLEDARMTLRNLNRAVDDASVALRQAGKTLKTADALVSNEIPIEQLEQALLAITDAARSIQLLADTIERRPESLIRGLR
jgi:paraquat-inducible protein B